ncbi:2-hydroxy-6-oxohepta-2,4-dienoate hydrolase [Helicobacter fennelliae]|nr:2-hydroxy-6-oxohepta-2,4-dienoate hydrolase [Helicobacter fennelliae]
MALRKITYNGHCFEIAYRKINNNAEKNIVFLHGWGSNKEVMSIAFERVFCDFNHYYIDLPGFGESPNEVFLSTKDYAEIINIFMESLHLDSVLVFGHSFGGKVAMLSKAKEVVLLSSAGILMPKHLSVKIKIYLAKIAKFFRVQLPFLRSKDAHNLSPIMYEIFKNVVNEDFSEVFATTTKKVSIFWGRQDRATPLSCGEQIARLIKGSYFFVLEGDHYFFIKQGDMIQAMYNQIYNQSTKPFLHLQILVFGKVQGVGYRKFAKAKAIECNITGTTENLSDGSVEIFAQGEESDMKQFLKHLAQGPERAEVSHISHTESESKRPFTEFIILQ